MSENELIEWAGEYQGTSNIHRLRALYSIKKRKFIRGFYKGNRVHGDILYRIYPGTYIVFDYHSWWQRDPPRRLQLVIVDIRKDEAKAVASAKIEFYKSDFLSSFNLPHLLDFYNAVPSYHTYPSLDFDKVYSEEENERLLKFIFRNNERIIREGEEHE
jgi:hypothetical protein